MKLQDIAYNLGTRAAKAHTAARSAKTTVTHHPLATAVQAGYLDHMAESARRQNEADLQLAADMANGQ